MTDDSLQEDTGLRTLPTDEINYMRNAVKATVDAYDGTVTLYEWDETRTRSSRPGVGVPRHGQAEGRTSPRRCWSTCATPRTCSRCSATSSRATTSPTPAWFQGNDRWEVPEDPNVANNLQPPYRMFVTSRPA